MHRRAALRRPRLLVGALAILVALPLASWQGAARASVPDDTVTTIELSTTDPVFGDTINVTAPVGIIPGGDPVSNGQVVFSAAPTQAELWDSGPQSVTVPLGPILVDGGTAYLELDTATLPFLGPQSQGFWLAARYLPFEGQVAYDHLYNQSSSDPFYVDLSHAPPFPPPVATTTAVDGPTTSKVGTATTLIASVAPSEAAGSVQFSVDGAPVGSAVPMTAGAASVPYSFATGGEHVVRAAFTPADPWKFGSSSGDRVVAVKEPTTVEVTAPASAEIGMPTTVTASVTPTTATGTVSFSIDGVDIGTPVAVEDGVASLAHTFVAQGRPTVRATFNPTDPVRYEPSSDTAGLDVDVSLRATSVVLNGPSSIVAGQEATLTATVTPADIPGRVTFQVDGRIIRTVAVTGGTAVLAHRFLSVKHSQVTATWKPADAGIYGTATSPALEVEVGAGSTAEEFSTFMSVSMRALSQSMTFPLSCDEERGLGRQAGPETVFSLLFRLIGMVFDLMRSVFDSIQLHFKALRCGAGRGARAEVIAGTVDCQLTATGLDCPFDLPAVSEITITGSLPVPAELAGERLELESSLSSVDPDTGELTPLGGGQASVRVPRKTVLTAALAPVRRTVTSVAPGRPVAYRLNVGNAGVLSADRVRACVAVGRGGEIRRAKGATIRGGKACWTLSALKKGSSVNRTLTVVAPQTGDLTLRATIRPKKAQADPLLLRTKLPVT